jgi:hypothetical protein
MTIGGRPCTRMIDNITHDRLLSTLMHKAPARA